MKITALIHDCRAEGESGFAARCAEFPEANGQGETIAEAMENMRSSMRDILAYCRSEAGGMLSASDHFQEIAL